MDSERIKRLMLEHAAEITRLHAHIHETFARRSESPEKLREWKVACAEMSNRFNALAFPGGYNGALDRISSGDPAAMEAAICFLECRPYFFRSGYMFKDIVRRCRRAPLSPDLAERFKAFEQKLLDWKQRKRTKGRKRQ